MSVGLIVISVANSRPEPWAWSPGSVARYWTDEKCMCSVGAQVQALTSFVETVGWLFSISSSRVILGLFCVSWGLTLWLHPPPPSPLVSVDLKGGQKVSRMPWPLPQGTGGCGCPPMPVLPAQLPAPPVAPAFRTSVGSGMALCASSLGREQLPTVARLQVPHPFLLIPLKPAHVSVTSLVISCPSDYTVYFLPEPCLTHQACHFLELSFGFCKLGAMTVTSS